MRNRALNILTRRTSVPKSRLDELFKDGQGLVCIFDAEQLIQLLGHIMLDRTMRARSQNVDSLDVARILWIEITDKLPDVGYTLKDDELDMRFHHRVKPVQVRPLKEDIAEYRRVMSA